MSGSSGSTGSQFQMPPLPRLTTAKSVVGWAQQLVNAIELQIRRMTSPQSYILGGSALSVTLTGTNQATAYQIIAQLTIATNVPTINVGAVLPPQRPGTWGIFVNGGLNACYLYPYGNGTLNGASPGAPLIVDAGIPTIWAINAVGQYFAQL